MRSIFKRKQYEEKPLSPAPIIIMSREENILDECNLIEYHDSNIFFTNEERTAISKLKESLLDDYKNVTSKKSSNSSNNNSAIKELVSQNIRVFDKSNHTAYEKAYTGDEKKVISITGNCAEFIKSNILNTQFSKKFTTTLVCCEQIIWLLKGHKYLNLKADK